MSNGKLKEFEGEREAAETHNVRNPRLSRRSTRGSSVLATQNVNVSGEENLPSTSVYETTRALLPSSSRYDAIHIARREEEAVEFRETDYLPTGSRSPDIPSTIPSSIRKMGECLKLTRDLIPEFDGANTSVAMFAGQCRAAAALLEPHEIAYLAILIRNRVTGTARKHIQDRIGISLDEILRILQNVYMPREDISQLAQELANINRKLGESIADYGTRVCVILKKIISSH